jgi:hypothetical protein
LYLVSRSRSPVKKLDAARWQVIFQILTVIGMILVLISLLLLLQGLGGGELPQAGLGL